MPTRRPDTLHYVSPCHKNTPPEWSPHTGDRDPDDTATDMHVRTLNVCVNTVVHMNAASRYEAASGCACADKNTCIKISEWNEKQGRCVHVGMGYRLAGCATPRTTPFSSAGLASRSPCLFEVLDALFGPCAYTLEMEGVPATLRPFDVLVVDAQGRGTGPRRIFRANGVEADRAVCEWGCTEGVCERRGEVVSGWFSRPSWRLGLAGCGRGRRLGLRH